ncbi:MAG: hypothetical protein H0X51_05460 [Parachlamydiaceae bacterium]|nr:hypothetical protein [Parachlamydiaceae bacterium]
METLKLRSSIKPSVMRRTVLYGTVCAAIGAFILLYSALFLSVETLSTWGLLILVVSGTLISVGLLPYRKLTRLERHPHELIAIEDQALQFYVRGQLVLTIPSISVQRYTYIVNGQDYGIAVHLKQPLPEKLVVHEHSFKMRKFQERSRKKYNCDLFFPYFSERSYDELVASVST